VRIVLAIGIIAVALAGAVYVHQRHIIEGDPTQSTSGGSVYFGGTSAAHSVHPSWEDPVAVFIALAGLAGAVGVAAPLFKTR
jgi:hypothetical protein